jgi:hypothetical protein
MGWGWDHGGLTDELAYGFWGFTDMSYGPFFFFCFTFTVSPFTVYGFY